MKYKGKQNPPCQKSQWPAYIDPLGDLYKALRIFFISLDRDCKSYRL